MNTTPTKPDRPAFRSFVLRLWRDGAATPWHASLRAVDEDVRVGFADAASLLRYLRRLMDEPDSTSADDVL